MSGATLEPERWVERHGDALYRFALKRLRDPERAEDLVQEAFLAAVTARGSFTGRASERTWLIGILKRKVYDHYRRSAREEPLPSSNIGADESLFDHKGHWKEGPSAWCCDPHSAAERSVLREILKLCIEELPTRMAQVFHLRELDGLATVEVCEVLEISQSNLGVLMHRARAQMRLCLELKWFRKESSAR